MTFRNRYRYIKKVGIIHFFRIGIQWLLYKKARDRYWKFLQKHGYSPINKSRIEFYKKMTDIGVNSVNDVRKLEDE
jgi:hypothetical protein